MSEDNNQLPDDDEAQRLLEELEKGDAGDQTPAEPEKAAPKKATRKKRATKKKAAAKPKAAAEPKQAAPEAITTITNTTTRVLNIGRIRLVPGESHTLTDQNREDDRSMRRVARAIELGILAAE